MAEQWRRDVSRLVALSDEQFEQSSGVFVFQARSDDPATQLNGISYLASLADGLAALSLAGPPAVGSPELPIGAVAGAPSLTPDAACARLLHMAEAPGICQCCFTATRIAGGGDPLVAAAAHVIQSLLASPAAAAVVAAEAAGLLGQDLVTGAVDVVGSTVVGLLAACSGARGAAGLAGACTPALCTELSRHSTNMEEHTTASGAAQIIAAIYVRDSAALLLCLFSSAVLMGHAGLFSRQASWSVTR